MERVTPEIVDGNETKTVVFVARGIRQGRAHDVTIEAQSIVEARRLAEAHFATAAQRRVAARRRRDAARTRRFLWGGAVGGLIAIAAIVGVALQARSNDNAPGSQAPQANDARAAAPDGTGELSQLRTPDFHAAAINPSDPRIVLYGHHGGVLRSADGGRTWRKTNLDDQGQDAMGVGISPADPNLAYAAGHNVFFKSTDGGRTWKEIKPKLPGLDIHGLAIAPDDPNRLYANVVRFGLHRSDDGGETWQQVSLQTGDVMTLSAAANGTVYAASMSGAVLRSTDGGKTFQPGGKLNGTPMTVASGKDVNVVYAGTESSFFASTDGGRNWTERSIPGGGEVMVAAANAENPLDVLVVAVRSDRAGHVYRSHDGGATWNFE